MTIDSNPTVCNYIYRSVQAPTRGQRVRNICSTVTYGFDRGLMIYDAYWSEISAAGVGIGKVLDIVNAVADVLDSAGDPSPARKKVATALSAVATVGGLLVTLPIDLAAAIHQDQQNKYTKDNYGSCRYLYNDIIHSLYACDSQLSMGNSVVRCSVAYTRNSPRITTQIIPSRSDGSAVLHTDYVKTIESNNDGIDLRNPYMWAHSGIRYHKRESVSLASYVKMSKLLHFALTMYTSNISMDEMAKICAGADPCPFRDSLAKLSVLPPSNHGVRNAEEKVLGLFEYRAHGVSPVSDCSMAPVTQTWAEFLSYESAGQYSNCTVVGVNPPISGPGDSGTFQCSENDRTQGSAVLIVRIAGDSCSDMSPLQFLTLLTDTLTPGDAIQHVILPFAFGGFAEEFCGA